MRYCLETYRELGRLLKSAELPQFSVPPLTSLPARAVALRRPPEPKKRLSLNDRRTLQRFHERMEPSRARITEHHRQGREEVLQRRP